MDLSNNSLQDLHGELLKGHPEVFYTKGYILVNYPLAAVAALEKRQSGFMSEEQQINPEAESAKDKVDLCAFSQNRNRFPEV